MTSLMNDGSVLEALCAEALEHLRAGRHQHALAWGKVAYVATRRFVHCWLPFIDIVASNEVLTESTAPEQIAEQTETIPRTIVQFWDKPEPPADVALLIEEWKSAQPGYAHLLFNDVTAHDFIMSCYGEYVARLYKAIEHVAGRADFLRLAWLAQNGGIYVDADDRIVGELGPLLAPGKGLVLNWSAGPPPCVNNWFIASRPRHPAIVAMLSQALYILPKVARLGLRLSPWLTTGPGLYSMVLMDEIAMTDGTPESLADLSFQRESDYRKVVQPVHDLEYRTDRKANWKLAYS